MQGNKKCKKITISFPKSDSDLVNFLEEYRKDSRTSEFVRKAIREKMNNLKNPNLNKSKTDRIEELEKRIGLLENFILKNDLGVVESVNNKGVKIEKNEKEEIDKDVLNAVEFFDL